MASPDGSPVLQFGAITFDFSNMHVTDLRTKVKAAILLGLERSAQGSHLRELLDTLSAISSKGPILFFTNQQEWSPRLQQRLSYQAVTTWTEATPTASKTVEEIKTRRSAVRILFQDFGDAYRGTVETTWHELLHPTVPFTHPQPGLSTDVIVDYPKWNAAIQGLKRDFPRNVTDPLTGEKQNLDFEWSLNQPCCLFHHPISQT